jgi:hypothetical protein
MGAKQSCIFGSTSIQELFGSLGQRDPNRDLEEFGWFPIYILSNISEN